jgi:hypothetical protein
VIGRGNYLAGLVDGVVIAALLWLAVTVLAARRVTVLHVVPSVMLVVAVAAGAEILSDRSAASTPLAALLGWLLVACPAVCTWAVQRPSGAGRSAMHGLDRVAAAAAVGAVGALVATAVDAPAWVIGYRWFPVAAAGVLAGVAAAFVLLRR